MHKDVFVFLPEHTAKAHKVVDFYLEETRSGNYEGIICISGVSGTGKSEIASEVHRILYDIGICSYIVNLDKFYKVNADVRSAWRKETDIIGHEEMDWEAIDFEVGKFQRNPIRVLIVEGLYANYVNQGIKFYIEGSIEGTEEFRKLRNKEDEDDPWRQYVVGAEYSDILNSIPYSSYRI